MRRSELLTEISNSNQFDVIVIGGGIHGATLADITAASGFKTLLLEKTDFAAGTSSRSSKMAHGGLRYLELFDFEQVFEGIKAREKLFADFPYLVRPHRFAVPVVKRQWWFRIKMAIGLRLYDLMTNKKERKYSWIPESALGDTGFSGSTLSLQGCFQYTDGLMHDARLVIERILKAKENGAICMNYAEVISIENKTSPASVRWRDTIAKREHNAAAPLIFNCAGPWAPFLHDFKPEDSNFPVRYSRGVHLLFNQPWQGPSLFLPMEGKARYYWIWPHPAGTMVGTTELDTSSVDEDPSPRIAEVQEVLDRIAKDLPNGTLNKDTLHYAFAGIRTLPLRKANGKKTAQLSRKHIWQQFGSIFTLYGGKFTTAEWTAYEGAQIASKQSGKSLISPEALAPGNDPQAIADWKEVAEKKGISQQKVDQLLSRYGHRVPQVFTHTNSYNAVSPEVLEGELTFAVEHEQAACIEDILRRRLELEYMPGAGLDSLAAIKSFLEQQYPDQILAATENCDQYRQTISRVTNLVEELRR